MDVFTCTAKTEKVHKAAASDMHFPPLNSTPHIPLGGGGGMGGGGGTDLTRCCCCLSLPVPICLLEREHPPMLSVTLMFQNVCLSCHLSPTREPTPLPGAQPTKRRPGPPQWGRGVWTAMVCLLPMGHIPEELSMVVFLLMDDFTSWPHPIRCVQWGSIST